jgi:hypothetical protein
MGSTTFFYDDFCDRVPSATVRETDGKGSRRANRGQCFGIGARPGHQMEWNGKAKVTKNRQVVQYDMI